MGTIIEPASIVRTLLVNGYVIDAFDHPAMETYLIRLRKRDLLGAEARVLLLFSKTLPTGLMDRLAKESEQTRSTPIVVSLVSPLPVPAGVVQYSIDEFFDMLGGAILTDRVFDPGLPTTLDRLGHNELPLGFAGKPDDLLEAYCKDCIQFLLECPVSRYGQERRFERLPDGLALGRNQFNVYFDAKAYASAFHPSADDIRRFSDYVKAFNQQYKRYVGALSVFAVISGSFSTDKAAIQQKADDFLAETSTPLCLIKAADLANSVLMIRPLAHYRGAINWKRILVPEVYDIAQLKRELERVEKDAIVD
jgi:hypothetical protein